MKLDNKTIQAWNNAPECFCGALDCTLKNHRICYLCGGKMIYGSHQSIQPNSRFSWNKDHVNPKSNGGTNSNSNLQATHVKCNSSKAESSVGNSFPVLKPFLK